MTHSTHEVYRPAGRMNPFIRAMFAKDCTAHLNCTAKVCAIEKLGTRRGMRYRLRRTAGELGLQGIDRGCKSHAIGANILGLFDVAETIILFS